MCPSRRITVYRGYWYMITASESLKNQKTYALKLKLEAGKPAGSNRSRVSNTGRVSNKSRGSDSIVLIQAGASIRGNMVVCLS